MERMFFSLAALLGFLGVALGAFGAHALKTRLDPGMLANWQTGVLYHLIHALALGLCAMAVTRYPGALSQIAGWLMLAGVVVFSGSLYVMALSGLKILGAVTPLGGLAFLGGWACLALAAWRSTPQ